MSAVRELVARLGFQVDKSGFQQAEQSIDKVRQSLRRTGDEAQRSGGRTRSMAASARMRDAGGRFVGGRVGGLRGLAGGQDEASGRYRDSKGRLREANGRFVKGAGKGAESTSGGKAAEGGEGGHLMKTLGKIGAAWGLEHMVESVIELGSRAEETANVLGAVFGKDKAAQISNWAETTAAEVGRSKYALQEMAGQLGAVAMPMLEDKQRAMEMSEAYAKLAVDMGSFYNTTDEDALDALRRAMTGEVESIKRYGVVMNDATMQEYARSQGIKKKLSLMTIAEKTELRYGYIMKATAAAQGDAARTKDGYANSIKAVKAMMTDFGTDMGRAVLPAIEKLLVYTRDGIKWFKQMTDGTFALKAAMGVLSGIAAALALELVLPWIPAVLGVGALILLIDELYALFTGGESVIGDFIDSMFGIGTTEDVVNGLRDAWQWLSDTFTELSETLPDLVGMWQMLEGAADDWGYVIERQIKKLLKFIHTIVTLPQRIGRKAAEMLGFKVDQEESEGRALGRGVSAEVADDGSFFNPLGGDEEMDLRRKDRETQIRAGVEQRNQARLARNAERAKKQRIKDIESELDATADLQDAGTDDKGVKLTGPQLEAATQARREKIAKLKNERAGLMGTDGNTAPGGRRFGVARTREQQATATGAVVPAAAPSAPASVAAADVAPQNMSVDPRVYASAASAPVSSMPIQQTVTNQTTIHVNGGDPEKVRKVVKQEIDANNRRAAAALPRPAGA